MEQETKKSDPLAAANAAAAARRAAGEPIERLDPIEKSRRNPRSHRLAVIAKCWECAGAGQDGTAHTKETIRTCTVACPLRTLRPHQREQPWLK